MSGFYLLEIAIGIIFVYLMLSRISSALFGKTHETHKITLSDALAASSGFQGLVGALPFDLKKYDPWNPPPYDDAEPPDESGPGCQAELRVSDFPTVHLWDGGVYDNSGLGVFHDFDTLYWKKGESFLVVSEASGPPPLEHYSIGPKALIHIIGGVIMPQIRGLRSQALGPSGDGPIVKQF